jgi:hypothetical protein
MADLVDEKISSPKGVEKAQESLREDCLEDVGDNLVYQNDDEEPELHARTWIAVACLFMLNYVQVFALQGPPAVVGAF